MRILGFVLVLALILWFMESVPIDFFRQQSLIIVLGSIIWGFTASAGSGTGRALQAAFSKRVMGINDLQLAIAAFRTGRLSGLAGGFFATGTGVIIMLKEVSGDPSGIGFGADIVIKGLIYAIFFGWLVLLPIQIGVEKRLADIEGVELAPADTPQDLSILVGSIIASSIVFFLIVIEAFP